MFRRLKPTAPSPRGDGEAEDDTYTWMVRLAERLARLDRLRDMSAPQTIVDAERSLVDRAKARLSPSQILFVLSRRDEVIRFFDPLEAPTHGASPDKATDPS
jgi:hypothetical protein